MEKRLYRSEKDKMVGGVCGGLAAFFGMDPTLVRLAFVVFTLLGGSGILLYIILWLIVPVEPVASQDTIDVRSNDTPKYPDAQ